MYLPPPARAIVNKFRQIAADRETRSEFRFAITKGKDEFLNRAITKSLSPSKSEAWIFSRVIARRRELLNSTDIIDSIDYGRGVHGSFLTDQQQQVGLQYKLAVSTAATWTHNGLDARFLYYLTQDISNPNVLELGTCVGISGSYIAAAIKQNERGHLWTLEGCPATANIARETFTHLGFSEHATVITGGFRDTLEGCLKKNGPFGLAFIDGHHEGGATLKYFSQIKPHMSGGGVLVFDDIDYADDMAEAWNTISKDASIRETRTIAHLGIAVLK